MAEDVGPRFRLWASSARVERSLAARAAALGGLATCVLLPRIVLATPPEASSERHAIHEVLRRHPGVFEACRRQAQAEEPGRVGVMSSRLAVEGGKARVTVPAQWLGTVAARCLQAKLEALTFPAAAEGQRIKFGFLVPSVDPTPPDLGPRPASSMARDADEVPSTLRVRDELVVELSPIWLVVGKNQQYDRVGGVLQAGRGFGCALRIWGMEWDLFGWTPVVLAFGFAPGEVGFYDGISYAWLGSEAGVTLRFGGDLQSSLWLGGGAGLGFAGGLREYNNHGGFGLVLSSVVRYRMQPNPRISAGAGVRTLLPVTGLADGGTAGFFLFFVEVGWTFTD